MNFRKKQITDKRYVSSEEKLETGSILQNRYEIKKTIGNGEFSIVYLAYDQILLQDVAVKELIDMKYEENFIHEARILFGKYEWKGFPEVKEVFKENEKIYLIMEYVSGKSLREYVKEKSQHRIMAENAVEMLLPVMSSLEFLHAEREIHGGISIDKIFLREDGSCCLLGVGTCRITQEMEYSVYRLEAPEVTERKEWMGPWSDVWGICAVLYELISGKRVINENELGKNRLKKLSDYVQIDGQIEKAIVQGLNSSIQQRFFCISTFVEQFKRKIPDDLKEKNENIFQNLCLGKLQVVWGEKWLQITTSDFDKSNIGKRNVKFRWTRRRKKKAAAIGILIGIICSGIAVGSIWYGNQPLTKKQLLMELENIETKQEYSDAMIYSVSKDFIEDHHLKSNMLHKFAIKKEDLEKCVENSLEMNLPENSSVQWYGNIYVYHDFMQRTEIGCYETQQYKMNYQGKDIEFRWKYDVVDEYVTEVAFVGGKDIAGKMIEELLPVLVPGSYLTDEEIEYFYEKADKEQGYHRMDTHGKYVLIFNHQEYLGEDVWEISFENYLDPKRDKEQNEKEEIVCTGNYERDSEEYKNYINFLEEKAESKEKTDEKIRYILNEDAVKEWGQPCNEFLLNLSVEELLEKIEIQGIMPERETEKREFTADIYPGGVIQTRFFRKEKYAVSENTKLFIISDYISGNIFSIYVYDEKNNQDQVADMASCVLELISKDIEIGQTERNFKEQLREMEVITAEPGNKSYTMMAHLSDCGYSLFRVNDFEHLCVLFEHHSFSFEENGYAPYDWV